MNVEYGTWTPKARWTWDELEEVRESCWAMEVVEAWIKGERSRDRLVFLVLDGFELRSMDSSGTWCEACRVKHDEQELPLGPQQLVEWLKLRSRPLAQGTLL